MMINRNSRRNALLVEILIVVLFFMAASVVILNTYVATRQQSIRSHTINTLLIEVQNLGERLRVCEDPSALLAEEGFVSDGEICTADLGAGTVTVTVSEEAAEAGVLRVFRLTAAYEGEQVFTLPCARYIPGEVSA